MGQVLAVQNHTIKRILILVACLFCIKAMANDNVVVHIEGIHKTVQKNVLILLGDLNTRYFKSTDSLKKKIKKVMVAGSEPLGFYQVEYATRISNDVITIEVNSFSTVYWSTPDIEVRGAAASDTKLIELLDSASDEVGSRMSHQFYENLKHQFMTVCLNNGYLDAHFEEAVLEVSIIKATARIILKLQTGNRYYFAPIEFEGAQLSTTFLQKMTNLKVGDAYKRSKVERFYKQLIDTRYFSSVKFERKKNDDNTITLLVVLKSSPRFRYSVGAGFATDVGPRLNLGLERPWINSSGHQLKVRGKFSMKIKNAASEYRVPLYLGWVDSFIWSTGWQNKDVEDTESEELTTGFSLHREIRRWVGSVSLNLVNEQDLRGGVSTKEESYLYLATHWSRTRIWGNARNPAKGYKFWWSAESSTEGLGSDTDFIRGEFGSKWLQGVGEKHSILLKGGLGFIKTGNFENILSSKRFFVGGDQTIRGYDYESLSPVDDNGNQLGGRYLNTLGIEYRYQLLPKWQVSIFTDGGRAYDEGDAKVNVGAGVGARWISPIGPLSIDVAYPIGDELLDGARLHIYMGPVI